MDFPDAVACDGAAFQATMVDPFLNGDMGRRF